MKRMGEIKAPRTWKKRCPAVPGGATIGNKVGVAIIEFTIILPLLVLMLIPMIDFGRLAYFAIEVSSAARAGVQYGAQSAATAVDVTGMQNAASNDALDVPGGLQFPTSPPTGKFCQCYDSNSNTYSTSSNCLAGDCSGSRLITYVQVNTSATVTTLLPYPGIPASFSLSGQAIMRVAQ